MALLIDGYNLLFAVGIAGPRLGPRGLEQARNALLNHLAYALEPEEVARTTVVFDAAMAPPGLPTRMEHRGLRVCFAAGFEDADALLEELIRVESAPKQLTVVSSDHRVQQAARRRKATAVDSDAWYSQLLDRRRRQPPPGSNQEAAKPPGGLSETEVEAWLREFGAGAIDEELDKLGREFGFPPHDFEDWPPESDRQ